MTTEQFKNVVALAETRQEFDEDDSVLYGLALPGFQPVVAKTGAVVRFVRWHAMQLNGKWDSEALNELRVLMRHRVQLV